MTTSAAGDPANERRLLVKIAAGDRDALAALYVSYHDRLFKFVYRFTRSHAEADELVNDVMLLVWEKASSFRGESRVSTWIFGIAYRVSMRRITRKKLSIATTDPDALPAEAQTMETEDWVRYGIRKLPPAQQATVILVFYLGLSYEEIAAVTDCPVNTVKTRMFHARRKLREVLEFRGAQSIDSEVS